MGMFKNIASTLAVALAGMSAAASGAGSAFGRALKGEHSPPPQSAVGQGTMRCRGMRNLSWAASKRKYGVTGSWTGLRNRDNPAGTKLARQAAKHALTINRIR